ncbi:MAG TPA: T9SS type A sorting domain-containing protein [Bacteroidota bacterium]
MKSLLSAIVLTVLSVGLCENSLGQWSGDSTVNTPIAVASGVQSAPSVFSNGAGGALITWTDARSGNNDAYAQMINASGAVQWTANGIVVSAATGDQNNPMAVSDGSGGYIITWWDTRNSSWDIYAQRINSSGVAQWTADGVLICAAAGAQSFPMLVPDGSGGAIITWQDARGASQDIYAQRINGSGVVQWTTDGVAVCTATGSQMMPNLISDGSGGAIIAWTDARGINYDIYAQRLNANGDTLWTADGVLLCGANAMQDKQAIMSDSAGGAIIVWEDRRSGDWDVYAQRVNASGVVQWTSDGVIIVSTTDDQTIPVLVSDGSGGAIIAWNDFRSGTNADIYAQRINSSGTRLWGSTGKGVVTLTSGQGGPAIAIDGSGGAIVAWNDSRNGTTDIYAQRLDASGNALWNSGGIAICAATGSQDLGVINNRNIIPIVSDGSGGAIIVWSDPRNGGVNDVYAQWVGNNSSLPVELASFSARAKQSAVELAWSTATEVNSYGFEVQRQDIVNEGTNGIWTKIGFVPASGTSSGVREYSFTDQKPPAGRYGYRLKQVDKNGSFKYSNVEEVEMDAAPKEFTLGQNYPNPFNPATSIEFSVAQNGKAVMKIYNVLGQEVATVFDQEAEAGKYYQAQFNATRLASGVYVSVLESGGKRLLRKMLLVK